MYLSITLSSHLYRSLYHSITWSIYRSRVLSVHRRIHSCIYRPMHRFISMIYIDGHIVATELKWPSLSVPSTPHRQESIASMNTMHHPRRQLCSIVLDTTIVPSLSFSSSCSLSSSIVSTSFSSDKNVQDIPQDGSTQTTIGLQYQVLYADHDDTSG